MTSLYQIRDGRLHAAPRRPLSREALIEDWVAENLGLVGLDALIIGRQVLTAQGGRIDLLAMDATGALIIIELKRDRTPREIVAQVLDYASWVASLTTPEVHDLAARHLDTPLPAAFSQRFDDTIPERLNASHAMLIVASSLDPASRRIVEYLSAVHGVAINTVFFSIFGTDAQEWLTTDFLLDQEAVVERSERKLRAPWSGYWFANAGLGQHRAWEDMKRYGFLAAGGGEVYSRPLYRLSVGDRLFAYDKGKGYIGYGEVTAEAIPAADFMTPDGPLLNQPLVQPGMRRQGEPEECAEHTVAVTWRKTVDPAQARWFKGGFANQNIVCKLYDQATVDFLVREFEVDRD